MRKPKVREILHAVKTIIKKPTTTNYPYEDYTPPEVFRGRPVPLQEKCIGCGGCVHACPANAIEMKDDIEARTRTLQWRYEDCIFCGQCERVCTTKEGVHLTQEFDLATTDRSKLVSELIKKELIICHNCGEIISTREQMEWLQRKLGAKTYGNINLINIISEKIPNSTSEVSIKDSQRREFIFEVLCPKCRRISLLFDEYSQSF